MKSIVAFLLLCVSFATIAKQPEIIQMSPDTYMIVKEDKAGIFGGGLPKLKASIIKQANDFAASQGKIAIPLHSSERPMGIAGQWAYFEYQFRVVSKNDPEAGRTHLGSSPDTVVYVDNSRPSAPKVDRSEDYYTRILKLDDLRRRGLITDEEFEAEKQAILRDL